MTVREQTDPRVKVRYLERSAAANATEWNGQTAAGRAILIRYFDGKLSFGVGDDGATARFSAAVSRGRCIGPVGHGWMTTERMLELMASRIVAEPEAEA